MVMPLLQFPAIQHDFCYCLLGGRRVTTNSLEENSSTTVEMQEKKALDEAIRRCWTTGEFYYQACSNSMLAAQESDNGSSQCWYRTDLPGFILVGQFLEEVMSIRMSVIDNPVALVPTLATLPPQANALKGMAKPLE